MAKKAEAKKTQQEPVIDPETKINLVVVLPEVVDLYLGKLGLSAEGPITERLLRLTTAVKPRDKSTDATCNVCGGRSDAGLARCPFCGDAEVDATIPLEARKLSEKDAIAQLRAKLEPAAPTSSGEVGTRKRRRIEAQTTLPDAPAPANVLDADTMSTAEIMKATEELDANTLRPDADGKVELPIMASPMASETQITIAEVEDKTATVDDLDKAVARVHGLVSTYYETAWDLGGELANIFTRKLWLQRRVSGAPKYSSWNDFVKAEVPMAVGYTYKLMRVATAFDRKAFVEYGVSKLLELLRLPEEDAIAMLPAARDLSVKQLREKVIEQTGIGAKRETSNPAETMNEVGKLIEAGEYGHAAAKLEKIAMPVGTIGPCNVDFSNAKGRTPVATRLGVNEKTIKNYVVELEAHGEKVGKARVSQNPPTSTGKALPPLALAPVKKGKAPAPAAKPAKAPPASPIAMVPITIGRVKLPLFVRPKKKGDEDRPAKRLADDPWCVQEFGNGITCRYGFFVTTKGTLQLIVDWKRER